MQQQRLFFHEWLNQTCKTINLKQLGENFGGKCPKSIATQSPLSMLGSANLGPLEKIMCKKKLGTPLHHRHFAQKNSPVRPLRSFFKHMSKLTPILEGFWFRFCLDSAKKNSPNFPFKDPFDEKNHGTVQYNCSTYISTMKNSVL